MYGRQLARLGALEDAVNVKSRVPRYISDIRAQRQKSAAAGPTALVRTRRPTMTDGQLDDALKHWHRVGECGVGEEEKAIDTGGGHRRECRVYLLKTARVGSHQLKPESTRGVVQHLGIVTPSRVERVAEHAVFQQLEHFGMLLVRDQRQTGYVACG